jgi:hypothetical protein
VVCLTLLWTSGMMPWTHLLRSTAGNCNWGLCGLRGWGGGEEGGGARCTAVDLRDDAMDTFIQDYCNYEGNKKERGKGIGWGW